MADGKWQRANGKSENFFLRLGPKCSSWQRTNQLHVRSLAYYVSRALLLGALLSMGNASRAQSPDFSTKEVVGRLSTNRLYTPVNQNADPAGLQDRIARFASASAGAKSGRKLLVTAGKTHELW